MFFQVYIAEPTEDPEELSREKVAVVPDDLSGEDSIKVYDPEKNQVTEGVPTREWLAEEDSEKPPIDQVVTNEGPAFVLRPLTEEGDMEEEKPEIDFMLSEESAVAEEPVVRGTRRVPEATALIVCDPDSGELFSAKQATDPDDLSKLKSGFLAPDAASGKEVMRVYDPQTKEMTKGVPAGVWLEEEKAPAGPRKAEPIAQERAKSQPTVDEDVPLRQQLVTDLGPAFTLRPLGGDGVAGDDSPDVDYVLCEESNPQERPRVTGLQAAPWNEEPVIISDPQTGEVFAAEPCQDPEKLKTDLSAYLPEDEEGAVKVFDPTRSEVAEAEPTESRKEKVSSPEEKAVPGKRAEEEPMEISDQDKRPEAPLTRQIMTDQGPAYTLKKAGQDGVASKDSPDVDFVLSKQTSGAEAPNVTGVRAVAKPQPLLVSDPQTGEVQYIGHFNKLFF